MFAHLVIAAGLTFSTCTGLPAGDKTTPDYWGQYFLDKFEAERAAAMTIEPATKPALATPRTVLLITGVTIPAEWFDPIKARLERDGFRPVVYEPPALLSGDLFANSEMLGDVIDGIRAQTGEERIDILAECTGGLIARHYIQALGGDKHVRRLVTFISPQHGLPKAAEAQLLVNWDAVRDLTPGSEFLDTVNSGTLPADVPVTSIYTCTDEYIQPFKTSIIPGAKNIGLACDGSKFIGHFQFFYDVDIYNLMHEELLLPAPTDATQPNQPPAMDDEEDTLADDDEAGGGCSTSGNGAGLALALAGLALVIRRRR
jgi:uncharacterized protein (TIGR03382 family)